MSFSNPITGGQGALVRPAIKSPNYVPGISGWTINRDGSAEFNNVVIRGDLQSADYVPNVSGWKLDYDTGSAELNELTARGSMQSGNFVTDVSGWRIQNNGVAEFYDLVARGTIATGASGQRIELSDDGIFALISLFSGDPQETLPATIGSTSGNYGAVTQSFLQLFSNTDDGANGYVNITLVPPFPGSPTPNGAIFVGGSKADGVNLIMNTETKIYSQNTTPLNFASINHAFQIGDDSGANLCMNNFKILARNNGAEQTLFLNSDGGSLACPDMGCRDSFDSGPRSTASTSYVRAGGSADVTRPCPSSKLFQVTVDGRLSISTGTATHAACLSWEARAGGGAGALLQAGSDFYAGITRGNTLPQPGGRTRLLDLTGAGVNVGDNIWIGAVLRSNNGANTATAEQISITAIPSM